MISAFKTKQNKTKQNKTKQKQANKITEGLRIFQRNLHDKKKNKQVLLLMRSHAITL